jgi:hypothetical protein
MSQHRSVSLSKSPARPPKRARSHHNIVAREAGDNDVGFASLETLACKEKLSIVVGAGEAEQSLIFTKIEQVLEPIDLRHVGRKDHQRGPVGFPLMEELILIKALEYAAAHDWKLPTKDRRN